MPLRAPEARYDVVVVGGGLVGASFACALSAGPLSVLVVEAAAPGAARDRPGFDARSTALSWGSRRICEDIGLWPRMAPLSAPIREIRVSDRGRFGSTRIAADEQGVEALGHVVENADFGAALNRALEAAPAVGLLAPAAVRSIAPTPGGMRLEIEGREAGWRVDAALAVLADGGRSPACARLGIGRTVRDYGQHAVVANVALESPHGGVAHERFTESGPLAMLPLRTFNGAHRGALVWTVEAARGDAAMRMEDGEILRELTRRFGHRLGRIRRIGRRFRYPLRRVVAAEQIRPALALLGNAAHTLHPVAGQGLNLALRDAAALAGCVGRAAAEGRSPGAVEVLEDYRAGRELDQRLTLAFTDGAVRLFSSGDPLRAAARTAGLAALDLLPPLKRALADQAMGAGAFSLPGGRP